MGDKPNILFIMVDEWRYPVVYESDELREWKKNNLKFHEMIKSKGTVFHNHYTNTTACSPSRATLQTGQDNILMFTGLHKLTESPRVRMIQI